MEEPDWSSFALFGGRLNGPDVFATWNTKMVSLSRPFIRNIDTDKSCMIQTLDFLCNFKDKSEDYGITGEEHIRGVQVAHYTFVERLEAQKKSSLKIPCTC